MDCYVYHIKRTGMSLEEGYIGVSSEPTRRMEKAHSFNDSHVGNAIRKYDDVHLEILAISNRENCYVMEKRLRPNLNIGWNIAEGGLGGNVCEWSDERKAIFSKKVSGAGNNNYGKTMSSEQRKAISLSSTGRKASDQTKQKISKKMTGKSNPMFGKTGEDSPHWGKKRPTETCPHCDKVGGVGSMSRWHFNNCKEK